MRRRERYHDAHRAKTLSPVLLLLLLAAASVVSCSGRNQSDGLRASDKPVVSAPESARTTSPATESSDSAGTGGKAGSRHVNTAGKTIGERFRTPDGSRRIPVAPGSFGEFLRNLALKPDGAEVRYFDGRVKANRGVYDAVMDVDVGDRDLQQCADAVMRLRAEYLYSCRRYGDIHFNFANGFRADYTRWMAGDRVVVEGSRSYWVKRSGQSNTYADLRRYLNVVFAYANTVSLAREMRPVKTSEMAIGDVFIDQGHSVIVVDMAVDSTGDKRLFMMAQSYMPAQDIQILRNPVNESLSPWYELDFGETLRTPEWTFTNRDLRRFE
jgi:hypothetical protein